MCEDTHVPGRFRRNGFGKDYCCGNDDFEGINKPGDKTAVQEASIQTSSLRCGKPTKSKRCTVARPSTCRRKSVLPRRSPEADDPNFSGITIEYHLCSYGKLSCKYQLVNVKPSTRLLFQKAQRQAAKEKKCEHLSRRIRIQLLEQAANTVEHCEDGKNARSKHCASEGSKAPAIRRHRPCSSCGIEATPLWRDRFTASGIIIPLCNACGIRLKKNRHLCKTCGYVARRVQGSSICIRCTGSRNMVCADVFH